MTPSRGKMLTARILVVVFALLATIGLLAGFIRYQALDPDTFRGTAEELIANENVQDQIAVSLVDELYGNVDVAAALEERLPDRPAAALRRARRRDPGAVVPHGAPPPGASARAVALGELARDHARAAAPHPRRRPDRRSAPKRASSCSTSARW